jgi:hypothetical protein
MTRSSSSRQYEWKQRHGNKRKLIVRPATARRRKRKLFVRPATPPQPKRRKGTGKTHKDTLLEKVVGAVSRSTALAGAIDLAHKIGTVICGWLGKTFAAIGCFCSSPLVIGVGFGVLVAGGLLLRK